MTISLVSRFTYWQFLYINVWISYPIFFIYLPVINYYLLQCKPLIGRFRDKVLSCLMKSCVPTLVITHNPSELKLNIYIYSYWPTQEIVQPFACTSNPQARGAGGTPDFKWWGWLKDFLGVWNFWLWDFFRLGEFGKYFWVVAWFK